MTDLSRLQADADACLAYLIFHQDAWEPEMEVLARSGTKGKQTVPMTLLATERAL